jgi:hypothetical protein
MLTVGVAMQNSKINKQRNTYSRTRAKWALFVH